MSLPWDPEVSRLHAELEWKAGEWLLCDDGFSQNGTFVNGLRIHGRRRLADGDLVRIGQTTFAYCDPSRGGTGITMAPGELGAAPKFSDQQQRILRALCRPLMGDGDGITPATDAEISAETGIAQERVTIELEHLGRSFGLQDMLPDDRRAEIALLALRSGLVTPATPPEPAQAAARPGLEPGDQLVQAQLLQASTDRLELRRAELDEPAALLAELERLAQARLAGVEPADDGLDARAGGLVGERGDRRTGRTRGRRG